MNNGEARRILAQLAEGVDPITGEVLPEQRVCNEPAVIRALFRAVSALDAHEQILPASQREKENERCPRANRVNNTKAWTSEEDTYLRHAHRCGASYEQMSAQPARHPVQIDVSGADRRQGGFRASGSDARKGATRSALVSRGGPVACADVQ